MNMSVSRWLPGKQSAVRNQGTRSQFPDDPNAFCFRMESEGVTSQGVVPLPVTSRPPPPPVRHHVVVSPRIGRGRFWSRKWQEGVQMSVR